MAIKQVFKSSISNMTYVLPKGKACHFINFEYHTDRKEEIEHLKEEIANGHPHIFIDENKKEIDTNLDPLADMKRRIIEEYEADKKRAADAKGKDFGKNDAATGNKGIGTSASVGDGAAGSSSGSQVNESAGARLASLKTK